MFVPRSLSPPSSLRVAIPASLGLLALVLGGCSGAAPSSTTSSSGGTSPASQSSPLDRYRLTGDVSFVRDPSIIRQGTTYYAFSTDPGPGAVAANPELGLSNNLQIRCSTDTIAWKICGSVFTAVPPAVLAVFPDFTTFWAPDISFFNGLYHVYYAASSFGQNHSLIGLATNTTLNASDPAYKWVDRGIVLSSQMTDNFNAIDPNILIDTDATGNQTHVWLQYGSYWGGIYQREIDPATGMLSTTNTTINNLAFRSGIPNDPIEGTSLVHKNSYYYLFVSFDYCCASNYTQSNYKIAVGRSTSANGPFVDQAGSPMLQGGGTILLQGNGTTWGAPGGQTIYIDPVEGDRITFHALNLAQNGLAYLFVNSITWTDDWPAIQP